ncbi:hypothetical protein CaCOL14_001523 [Colletotrichum acutatum]
MYDFSNHDPRVTMAPIASSQKVDMLEFVRRRQHSPSVNNFAGVEIAFSLRYVMKQQCGDDR